MNSFNQVWSQTLAMILGSGDEVSPRGKLTKELPQYTVSVNMRQPVLTMGARNLSYQFMAAEAFWILSGDDKVDGIAPWNKRIADFSDDGETFFGAYGPKVVSQLDYVVDKLLIDKDSRQAGLTIWRENPTATKDVPCTIAIFCNIRNDKLNVHVFMRSSDAWLGLPYDVFNFSMLGHLVCARLNRKLLPDTLIEPGILYVTAASSHLYDENFVRAFKCHAGGWGGDQLDTPPNLYTDECILMETLAALRDSKPGDILRWWDLTMVGG